MKIAIIGGIGSGKSEALRTAKELGFATLSADEINSELLAQPSYVESIARLFSAVVTDGKVDRRALAKIIFQDEAERKKLNSLAHPLIVERIKRDSRSPLVVEVPLILESGAKDLFDEIILVKTPLDVRVERLMSSRGMSREDVLARIASQADEKALEEVATKVVVNGGTLEDLQESIREVLKTL